MNKVINIDWLQINCKGIFQPPTGYTTKRLPYSTRVFEIILELYYQDLLICTIASKPLSPIIPQDTNLIKFNNKILYMFDGWYYIDLLINKCNLKFKNISRLDICCDFNLFDCNLSGNKFIENFLNNKYYHYAKTHYTNHGRQGRKNYNNSLRFGSNTSIVAVYLYNKSMEMDEVKFKQHIYNHWKHNGLNLEKPIWRLEFSIKSSQLELVNGYYGQTEKLSISNIRSIEWLTKLFFVLCNKYFSFAYNDILKPVKKLKKIPLFHQLNYNYISRINCNLKDTNRSDKVFIKKLEAYNNELRATKKDLSLNMEVIKNHYISTRKLEEYYYKKVCNS